MATPCSGASRLSRATPEQAHPKRATQRRGSVVLRSASKSRRSQGTGPPLRAVSSTISEQTYIVIPLFVIDLEFGSQAATACRSNLKAVLHSRCGADAGRYLPGYAKPFPCRGEQTLLGCSMVHSAVG